MTVELTFLGTSSGVPSKDRSLFSVHTKFLNNRFLFDCGEGTQRQMILAELSPYKIQSIFLSHVHADHNLGLVGLMQTLAMLDRTEELNIYGPKELRGIIDFFSTWGGYFEAGYPIRFHEVREGRVFENQDFSMTAFKLEHSIACYGYAMEEKVGVNLDMKKLNKIGIQEGPICRELKEKGEISWKGKRVKLSDYSKPRRRARKIVYVVDTLPCENVLKYSKGADILICEATHAEDLKERSHEYFHMTAKDAARLAKKAGVGRLILTHFSARYEDEKALEKEARTIFKDTIAAKDLMKIEL